MGAGENPMALRTGKFKPSFVFVVCFLLMFLAVGYYVFFYVPAKRLQLTERYMRLAAMMSYQFESLGENISKVVEDAWNDTRNLDELKRAVERKEKRLLSLFDNVTLHTNVQNRGEPSELRIFTDINYVPKEDSLGFSAQSLASQEKGDRPEACMYIKVEEFVSYISRSQEFEDIIIIDAGNEDVIYLKGQGDQIGVESNFLATRLGELARGSDSASSGQNEAKPQKDLTEDHLDKTSIHGRVLDFAVGQSSYKIFLQPIPLRFIKHKESKVADKFWYIGGLIPTRKFDQRTHQLPVGLLLLFVVLIFVSLTAYPLLKIALMGTRDRFRLRDVLCLLLSLVIMIPVVVYSIVTLSDSLRGRSQESVSLADLSGLAQELHANFMTEIHLAYRQLTALINITEDKKITLGMRDIWNCRSKPRGGSGQGSISTYPYIDFSWLTFYPYFDLVFLAGSDGQQQYKFNRIDIPVAFHNVYSREYFRRIIEKRYWYLDQPTEPLAMELVYSMTNASYVLILSIPCEGMVAPEGTETKVAAISFRPFSVTHAFFPAHYGYAIIDSSGKVMFHSDHRLNSIENFFSECDNPAAVRGAIFSKSEPKMPLQVKYQGQSRDIYVKHFEKIPWTIVVFKDRNIDGLFSLTAISDAVWQYGVYVLLFSLSFLLFVGLFLLERRLAPACGRKTYRKFLCVWPDHDLSRTYILLSIINAAGFIVLVSRLFYRPTFLPLYSSLFLLLGYLAIMISLVKKSGERMNLLTTLNILIIPVGVILFWSLIEHSGDILWKLTAGYVVLIAIYFVLKSPVTRLLKRKMGSEMAANSHTVLIYSLILLLFAYPALATYRLASEKVLDARLKYNQLTFVKSYLAWRTWVKQNYVSDPCIPGGRIDSGDIEFPYTLASQKLWINGNTSPEFRVVSKKAAEMHGLRSSREFLPADQILMMIKNTFPIDHEPLARILYLIEENISGSLFHWTLVNSPAHPGEFLKLCDNDITSFSHRKNKKDVATLAVVSERKDTFRNPDTVFSLIVRRLLVALFLTVVLFMLIKYISKRIFLSDYEKCERDAQTGDSLISEWKPSPGCYFILGKPGPPKQRSRDIRGYDQIDTQEIVAPKKSQADKNSKSHGLIIRNFDYDMTSASSNLKKLGWLERRIFVPDTNITIFSVFEPLHYFNLTSPPPAEVVKSAEAQDKKTQGPPNPNDAELLTRWKRVLGRFSCKYLLDPRAIDLLKDERNLGDKSEDVKPIYDSIWYASTREEKLVMIHLAHEGLVNAKDRETIYRLLKRRLIRLNPTRLMNDTFSDYVESAQDMDSILRWEKESLVSDWKNVSRPLLFLGVGTIVFLIITQPGLLNSWLGVAAALTTSIPAVLRGIDGVLGNIAKKT
jgi:hypothetical protein